MERNGSNAYYNKNGSDVFKRTVPDRHRGSGSGTRVLIYGKLKGGEVNISGVLQDIRTYKPRPNGLLPRRVVPR